MIHFSFSETDSRYMFLKFDNDVDKMWLEELESKINLVPKICYLPTFKGEEYTEDYLYKYNRSDGETIYYASIGMWWDCWKFFKENAVAFDGLDPKYLKRTVPHTIDEFKAIVDGWGLNLSARGYQYECAYNILSWKRSISSIATRAGKTLIAYIVFRYAMEYLGVKNILMITPSVDLVKQGYNDFKAYKEFFNTECIWAGGKLVQSSNVTIGTFQSLIKFLEPYDKKKHTRNPKYNPHFFDKFDIVFVDETHRATANQIKAIISQEFMKNLTVAFGLTGTLPKDKTSESFCLHSLIGAKIQTITPKQLMDGGYISKIEINQYILNYTNKEELEDTYIRCAEYAISDTEKDANGKPIKLDNPHYLFKYKKELPYVVEKLKKRVRDFNPDIIYDGDQELSKADYIKNLQELVSSSDSTNNLVVEKMMTHFMSGRIDVIKKLLYRCNGNTLILAHHVEYSKTIYNELKENFPDRPLLIVTGAVSSKKRDQVKEVMKNSDNAILVASYACMSTGITLPKLMYGILAESFKSNVVNMQSLGRGLGLVDGKDKYVVYDLIDDFPTKRIFSQGSAKIKIYKENQYPYTRSKIDV